VSAILTQTNEAERLDELQGYAILDTPPEELFDEIAAVAALSCAVPIALISLVDRDRQWFKSKVGLETSQTPREDAFCAHTILESEPLVIEDATADPRFVDNPLVRGEPYIRFYAGVPLRTPRGLAVGSLSVIDRRPRVLSAEQLRTLRLLAAQVVQQLELRRVAEAMRRQSRLLDETQRMAQIGGWQLDLASNTLLWTDETYRIHGLTRDGYLPAVDAVVEFYAPTSIPRIRRAVETAIATGAAYDLELEIIRADGARRWVRTTGAREGEPGHYRLFGVFQDITDRRSLEHEIVLIAQREQARIGAELHDGLGQELTGISLLLRALASKTAGAPLAVRSDVLAIEELLLKAIRTCGSLARGLSPTGIEPGGLLAALRRHASRLGELHQIDVRIRTSGTRPIVDGFASDHLFRIAQEAITNAIRHGAAQRIVVAVGATPEQTTLSISDDGRWLERSDSSDGMGLRIMRYRARLIGANLQIQAGANGGTRVRCSLPHAPIGGVEQPRDRQRRQSSAAPAAHRSHDG
jgi:signal transduction histidine kinase